jgi:hypothetical protein
MTQASAPEFKTQYTNERKTISLNCSGPKKVGMEKPEGANQLMETLLLWSIH